MKLYLLLVKNESLFLNWQDPVMSIPFFFTNNVQLSSGKGRRIKTAQAKVL
jgi:hypothetical protein